MNIFYLKSALFWFVLLIIAIFNAAVRELTYKPLLEPIIGSVAHQISSVTGIILFYFAISLFLKRNKGLFGKNDLFVSGMMWMILTILFETLMNLYVRHLSFKEVLETYYFWKGETWIFVLISLIIMPQLIYRKKSLS